MSTSCMITDAYNNLVLSPENPTAALVFLHGLGDTGHGWSDAMEVLSKKLPHVKFVLPTGKRYRNHWTNDIRFLGYLTFLLSASSMPVTLNMGMQMPAWYDIKSLGRVDGGNADGIDTSRDRIMTIIEKEVGVVAEGIPSSRIVLGGFSQGAALSMFSGYQTKIVLGGILAMSGYLPRYDSFQLTPDTANVPLLMCHGEQDPVVRFDYGKMSKVKLETAGVKNVEFYSYPDMEHSACMEELDDVTKWLQRVIPETQN
ncbi:hypothetical protein DD237_007804 [Peronospora effusa]|uniref:palmitoyl-protein hydrolase n=1 Tax=Peronospora effusa TaxID=542832 RepID=A0A3R7Y169_9STRA|nr:hypothetical protein DD237_007804 [Peronospora effusa]